MNVAALNEKLIGSQQYIQTILEELGFQELKYHNGSTPYFQFPRLDGDNKTAMVVYTNSLRYKCFTHPAEGNIYSLIMEIRGCNFPQALTWICQILGFAKTDLPRVHYPFHGFYKSFIYNNHELDDTMKTYPEEILKQYSGRSRYFFDEGVNYEIQNKFEISIDHNENAIVIPIRNMNGKLVGVKCRNNDLNCDFDKRFWAAYKYSKSHILYGLFQNYSNIIKKNTIIIMESEKSVLRCASWGLNVVVAIGGHDISDTQARIVLSLLCKRIIVMFDEDVSELETLQQVKKFVMKNKFYCPQIGYFMNDGILSVGSKMSPTDLGFDVLKKIIDQNIKWIKKEEKTGKTNDSTSGY